jgi:hypothetical protein
VQGVRTTRSVSVLVDHAAQDFAHTQSIVLAVPWAGSTKFRECARPTPDADNAAIFARIVLLRMEHVPAQTRTSAHTLAQPFATHPRAQARMN